ncbi:unnamed protein product [Bathycoccus prasinos]|jgi:hypothetical protein|tara:strand:- start:462 stop:938 length:477 start_codon:yes stop_codon:yes gene_type:complete
MDFISTLYETFSGQTLGRPDKKHKRKLRNTRTVSSVAKSPILMSLKSPQKGKVAKKKSTRPNLKSITNTSNNNKPVPPNKKSSSKNNNNTIDEKKRTSAIQSAIERGEKSTLPSLMRKIETKKRAILVQIEALEKEVRTKKAEVVELEKELLLGASSW